MHANVYMYTLDLIELVMKNILIFVREQATMPSSYFVNRFAFTVITLNNDRTKSAYAH